MNPLLSFLHLSPMEEPIILQQWREPGWFLIEHYIITYSIKQREWHSLTRARRKKKTPQNLFVAECCAWETLFSLWFQPSSMHLFKLHRPFSQESSHQQNISDDSQNLKYKLHCYWLKYFPYTCWLWTQQSQSVIEKWESTAEPRSQSRIVL